MVAGVEEIVTIVARYSQIEALYLSRPKTILKQDFERHLLSLYKHILRYQISATCYYRRNTMREFPCVVLCMPIQHGADRCASPIHTCLSQARRCLGGVGDHSARRHGLPKYWPGV
jgi:hypothetical protein